MTRVACAAVLTLMMLLVLVTSTAAAQSASPLPAYRLRILGVFDSQSGQPVEGAEVIDAFARLTAVTTKTGTVSLAFLPEGGSMLRIQKIGYKPVTQVVEISSADTIPITVLMEAAVQTLPAVVTKDSTREIVPPGLRAFEERRKTGMGRFITALESVQVGVRGWYERSDGVRRPGTGAATACGDLERVRSR